MGARPVTVPDILDGHVTLDVECLDRIDLNLYVPTLQVPGQVVTFLTRYLGFPIPSPAVVEKIGTRFRRSVEEFAGRNDVPVVRFAQGRPQDRGDAAASGPAGPVQVAAIGVARSSRRSSPRRPARPGRASCRSSATPEPSGG